MRLHLAAAATIVCIVSGAADAAGQAAAPAHAGTGVFGSVVEQESLLPLSGARIVLEPLADGDRSGEPGSRPGSRSALSDAAGRYRFDRIAPGEYRIAVHALGYRPVTLELLFPDGEEAELSVGLRLDPIVLEPVQVEGHGTLAAATFQDTRAEGWGSGRERVERGRQRRYMTSDSRMMTRSDAVQAITLGETDLFRSFQRLPGVTTRDGYTAELWTRGAPWDQTMVYFDGVPLFNPLHAVGAFSAVNPDAVGAAIIHPGLQPAEIRSAGAAVVELRSRRATGEPFGGDGELSLIGGRLTLRDGGPGGGWMVSLRRSHADLSGRGLSALAGDSIGSIPFRFLDLAGRIDHQLPRGAQLEASGLLQSDRLSGDVPGLVAGTSGTWGSGAGQLQLGAPWGPVRVRQAVGISRFSVTGEGVESMLGIDPCGCQGAAGYNPTRGSFRGSNAFSAVEYLFAAGTLEPSSGAMPWSVGYRLVSQSSGFRTDARWAGGSRTRPTHGYGSIRYAVLWGERRWQPLTALAVEGGARVEMGGSARESAPVRLAPHVAVRLQPDRDLQISATAARSYQYAQAIVPSGPGPHTVAVSHLFWAVAGPDVPALRADVATVGIERWLPGSLLASGTLYARSARGVLIPDPTQGWSIARPLFVEAENLARGVEISVRKLVGWWTAAVGYSYTDSRIRHGEVRFAAPNARPHALDASLMMQVAGGFRAGAAYSAMSGAAFTRREGGLADCGAPLASGCRYMTYGHPPGGERGPAYRGLDLLADWSTRYRGWEIGAYAQLSNALGNENPGAYQASGPDCLRAVVARCRDAGLIVTGPAQDRYLPSMQRIPAFGVRVGF